MEQEIFEKILLHCTEGRYEEEVKTAREEYFEQIKDLREDDPSFERLMSCFLNWYVYDRPLRGDARTPIQLFAQQINLSPDEQVLLASMAANIHSLFEITRIHENGLHVRDLFTNEIIRVDERRKLSGLEQKDILEARLLPVGDKLIFARGAFVLHPQGGRKLIHQIVNRCRHDGQPGADTIIKRLQALCFRYNDRFRQRIPIEKVYAEMGGFIL